MEFLLDSEKKLSRVRRDDGSERIAGYPALSLPHECDPGYLPCMSSYMDRTLKSRHQALVQ